MFHIYMGSTDASTFEDFVEQLLHRCNPRSGPYSVITMDDVSPHHPQSVQAGFRTIFLLPYPLDLHLIEEFFTGVKAVVRLFYTT